MSVAQIMEKLPKTKPEKKEFSKKKLLMQAVSFVLGFSFGCSGVSENFSPFGVAFCASQDLKHLPASLVGSLIGYICGTDSVISLRYCAALLAVTVISVSLRQFIIKNQAVIPVITSFSCIFVTGLAIVFSKDVTALSLILCLCEAVCGGGAAYLFYKVRNILSVKSTVKSLTSGEAILIIVSLSLLLLSVKNISFFGIFPAQIVGMLAVLICGYYGREWGGSAVGICTGLSLSLGSGEYIIALILSFCGLVCGAVSRFGKIVSAVTFVAFSIVLSVVAYGNTEHISIIGEVIAASVLFLIMPKNLSEYFSELLTPVTVSPAADIIKADISKRLIKASEASSDICTSLTGVSSALKKTERTGINTICKKTKDSICGSCGLYDSCWNESFDDTQDCFNTLICMKKEGKYLEYKSVPTRFSSRCIRTEMICSSFNKMYSEYKIKEREEARINEIYSAAAQQFVNVSALLMSLENRLGSSIHFEKEIAENIKTISLSCGYKTKRCVCTVNSLDKMTVEIQVFSSTGKTDTENFIKQTGILTNRKFMYPETEKHGEFISYIFKEKADFDCIFSANQICCNSEKYSGDTYSVFKDDDGIFYALICDGMGTGTKAAVNSGLCVTLAEKMLKAGFGAEAVINTVNSSLISKSFDECSVTFDLLSVDLFTGHTEIYKCGAAPSFIKKQGKVNCVGTSSLPLGILRNTEVSKITGTLGGGDCLVLFSDGVREEDYKIIKSELKAFDGGNVRKFTENLSELIKENQPERNDDITVVTVALNSGEY